MFSSVRTPRVYEHIVAQIERAIFEGRLQQGDKLPAERQLVREFGASRVAVREALRALEHRGLVEVRQGSAGGYFIREMDDGPVVRDFQTLFRLGHVSLPQLVEARALIEPESARLAAVRATEPDVKAVLARGGLESYASALRSPFLHVPHDAIVPGALLAGDLPALATAVGRRLKLEGQIDGLNRAAGGPAGSASAWLIERLR